MVNFQTKNTNLGKFWRSLEWYILWPFGNFVAIWYIFPRFGILCQVKSGNPARLWYLCNAWSRSVGENVWQTFGPQVFLYRENTARRKKSEGSHLNCWLDGEEEETCREAEGEKTDGEEEEAEVRDADEKAEFLPKSFSEKWRIFFSCPPVPRLIESFQSQRCFAPMFSSNGARL
jgi:hypothetical protein